MSKEQLLDRLNAARERDKQLQRRLEVADEDLMEAKTEQIGVAGDLADASIFIFLKKIFSSHRTFGFQSREDFDDGWGRGPSVKGPSMGNLPSWYYVLTRLSLHRACS